MCKLFLILVLTLGLSEQNEDRSAADDQTVGTQNEILKLEERVKQLQAEEIQRRFILSKLSDDLLKLTIGGCGGVLFEHWGKETCPPTTTFVYSGYAAGSYYSHSGGSGQTLCLPKDPIGGDRPSPASHGTVYGSEYETNFFGPLSADEDVPCSVCISKQHNTKLMIPGRNECYNGWNEIYRGYLAGNHYNNGGREGFLCMSEHPEFIFGGKANSNGRLFYGIISTCGSLPCPPYNESVPLTCVLCGKI